MNETDNVLADRIRGLEMALTIAIKAIESMAPSVFAGAKAELLNRYQELGQSTQLPGAGGGASKVSVGCALALFDLDVDR